MVARRVVPLFMLLLLMVLLPSGPGCLAEDADKGEFVVSFGDEYTGSEGFAAKGDLEVEGVWGLGKSRQELGVVAELHQDLGETGFSLGADYELLPTERFLIGVHAERVFGDLGRVAPYAGAAEIGVRFPFGKRGVMRISADLHLFGGEEEHAHSVGLSIGIGRRFGGALRARESRPAP